jgi:hypothetical protein
MMDERQMDMHVRGCCMGIVDKRPLKQGDWATRGHHHKRGKGKIHFFLHKVSYLVYKTFCRLRNGFFLICIFPLFQNSIIGFTTIK